MVRGRFRRVLLCVLALCVVASGWVTRGVVAAQGPAPAQAISPEALAQIAALLQEKQARTPVERKIDSQLLYAIKQQRGQPIAAGVALRPLRVTQGTDGKIDVDITANAPVSGALLTALATRNADVVGPVVADRSSVRARVDADSVLAIAARPDVTWVQPHQGYMLSGRSEPFTTNLIGGGQGSRDSEGNAAHRAAAARAAFGVDGTGITIGVISDGVEHLSDSQAAGDLGPVTVLPGQAGSGDEGTAMLEIIHDLAPGAQLVFATADSSITQFAQNIRDLRAAGCDIIVDDVSYFVETPFQDGQTTPSNTSGGIVTQAVNDVTAAGALYFSSAGNEGNVNDGTGGAWEGDFVNGGTNPMLTGYDIHDFGGQLWDVMSSTTSAGLTMFWSDPLGASSNDYDVFILNSAGTTVVDSSTNTQNGTQDPYERTGPALIGDRVVVARVTGAAGRFLHVNTNRGTLSTATAGQTHGHSAALDAYSVAATPAAVPYGAGTPGPYPNAFTAANAVETFESDGPRRIFFDANGTPITPGNVSATGGTLRQKPDITAADGVAVTGVGGFGSPFYGTSAAAPHAAAIAALIKQARPAATPAQIRTWLTSTAIDIETAGADRDSGAGIIMPVPALQAAGLTGTAAIFIDSFSVSENPGNGDGLLYGGEGGKLTASLTNLGFAPATVVRATLSSTTPGVTITAPAARAYPDLAVGAVAANAVPFTFTLASDLPCVQALDFVLTVTFAGAPAPQTFPLTIQLGIVDITEVLDATAPASSPLYTATTGHQASRLTRNGVTSTCSAPKATPGLFGGASLSFDAYTFTTCASSAPSCVEVALQGPASNTQVLFSTTYTNSFDPSNPTTNYLADPGRSDLVGAFVPYSFSLPAGGSQTIVVDVLEASAAAAVGATYHLRVSGMCLASCTRNRLPIALAQNVTVVAGPGGTAPASVNNGSNDPDSDPLTVTQSPAGPYPVGQTVVLLTVTDDKGATSQATATVSVLPAVTAIAPTFGRAAGGTVVTISGSGFSTTPGGTMITFSGILATDVTCASSTQCQATSPAGTGTANVRVTVASQTSLDTPADDFTYTPAPTITAIAPASGAIAGGTIVTITGTGFSTTAGATTVMFGAAAAINVSCGSTTQCVATSPAGTGTVSVRATVDGQTSADTAADDFAYSTRVYLLAEGATGGFFDEDVLIANPNTVAAPVTLKFLKEDGSTVTDPRTIGAQARMTVHVDAIPGLEASAVSAEITSESGLPLAVERSMFWDASYYAGHTANAVSAPAMQWYFAEGSQGFFDTYVLINNPNASPTEVTVTFLREGDTPLVKTVTVAGTSRFTLSAGDISELHTRSFAITVEATQPVTAERAMYFGTTATHFWNGGTASAGSPLSQQWYYAEGATGSFFDTFFLVGNPQGAEAHVEFRYVLDTGEVITVPKTVPAHGRLTVNVKSEADERLRSAAFATIITSDVAIVSERSMYWPGQAVPWGEAHNSAGVNELGTAWGLGEGRVGGAHHYQTYILLVNPQSTPASVTVTYLRESGAPVVKTYTVQPTSRFTIDANSVTELSNESFGAKIEVINGVNIGVERSMYWDANGVFWSGGSNGTGIRMP